MDLLSHVTEAAGKHQLNLRVDVLHSLFDHELTPGNSLQQLYQSFRQCFQLIGLKKSDGLEHGNMCKGPDDVIFGQHEVHFTVFSDSKALNFFVYGFSLIPDRFHIARFFNMISL